jgi:hypothetical protein
MRAAASGKKAANEPEDAAARLEQAVAKLAEHSGKADHSAWIRATRLRHTALAMASLEVAEAIRELKAEIAELRGASGHSER